MWAFLERNQDLWDSRNVEKNILGKEPKWLKVKRKLDVNRNIDTFFWTEEEKALAKLLIAQGKNNHMVAEQLGKTDGAVRSFKYRNLISSQNPWTTKEIRYVKQNMKDLSIEEMALHLNRTIQAVANMKDDLEYDFQDDLSHTWTEEENSFLKQQYGKMKKYQIANQLGVSNKVLTEQLNALGILRKVHIWTDEEDEYIKRYYKKGMKLKFSKLFHVSPPYLNKHLRELGIDEGKINSEEELKEKRKEFLFLLKNMLELKKERNINCEKEKQL